MSTKNQNVKAIARRAIVNRPLTNACIQRFIQIESSFAFTLKWSRQIDAILCAGASIPIGRALINVCVIASLCIENGSNATNASQIGKNYKFNIFFIRKISFCNYNQAQWIRNKQTN